VNPPPSLALKIKNPLMSMNCQLHPGLKEAPSQKLIMTKTDTSDRREVYELDFALTCNIL